MKQTPELNEATKSYHEPMHTAEHILNQTMVRMFACDRSFNNHIERKKSKCDYHFNRALTDNEMQEIESKVNEIINQHLPVDENIISRDEAAERFSLARLPDSAGHSIRVITVGNYDACPCIGAHVENTSEISAFKLISSDFNNGVLRVRYKLIALDSTKIS